MRRVAFVLACAALGLGHAACKEEPAGDAVGTFSVRGALEENSCGTSAVDAIDPLAFGVEVREGPGVLYWKRGRQSVPGALYADDTFLIEVKSTITLIERNTPQGIAGCRLTQTERIRGSLVRTRLLDGGVDGGSVDAGTPAGGDAGAAGALSLRATNTIEFTPQAGSNCRLALSVEGGPFNALPCEVRYALEASGTAPPRSDAGDR